MIFFHLTCVLIIRYEMSSNRYFIHNILNFTSHENAGLRYADVSFEFDKHKMHCVYLLRCKPNYILSTTNIVFQNKEIIIFT